MSNPVEVNMAINLRKYFPNDIALLLFNLQVKEKIHLKRNSKRNLMNFLIMKRMKKRLLKNLPKKRVKLTTKMSYMMRERPTSKKVCKYLLSNLKAILSGNSGNLKVLQDRNLFFIFGSIPFFPLVKFLSMKESCQNILFEC